MKKSTKVVGILLSFFLVFGCFFYFTSGQAMDYATFGARADGTRAALSFESALNNSRAKKVETIVYQEIQLTQSQIDMNNAVATKSVSEAVLNQSSARINNASAQTSEYLNFVFFILCFLPLLIFGLFLFIRYKTIGNGRHKR